MPDAILTRVGGTFVKIAFARDAELSLARGHPDRPAARFNRKGQDALYLSPDELSARIAIGQYVKPDDPPRVLLTYELDRCALLDLRNPDAATLYDLARQPWRSALEAGEEPLPWKAAERIRDAGHAGLIDPSRRRPGLWHVTLFRWNEAGAPGVRRVGMPEPIAVEPSFR